MPPTRRLNGSLFVLVPDERPLEGVAPEQADLPVAVARHLAEKATASKELVSRLDHAELVAARVGQHDVVLVRELPDVEVAAAKPQHGRDRASLILQS